MLCMCIARITFQVAVVLRNNWLQFPMQFSPNQHQHAERDVTLGRTLTPTSALSLCSKPPLLSSPCCWPRSCYVYADEFGYVPSLTVPRHRCCCSRCCWPRYCYVLADDFGYVSCSYCPSSATTTTATTVPVVSLLLLVLLFLLLMLSLVATEGTTAVSKSPPTQNKKVVVVALAVAMS